MKRFKQPISSKAFAREVLVGVLALGCLFAIFLFVALQKSTGKSLSPLAYLWPDDENAKEESFPVVVFRTEADRLAARSNYQSPKPMMEEVMGKFKASTDRLVEKRKKREQRQLAERRRRDEKNSGLGSSSTFVARSNSPDANPLRTNPPATTSTTKSTKRVAQTQVTVADRSGRPNSRLELPPSNTYASSTDKSRSNSFMPSRLDQMELPKQERPNQLNSDQFSSAAPTQPNTRDKVANQQSSVQQASFQSTRSAITKPESDNMNFNSEPDEKTDHARAIGMNDNQLAEIRKNALRIESGDGDSFWSISEQYYGDGKHFASLALFNKCSDNIDDLPDEILVPTLGELQSFQSANRRITLPASESTKTGNDQSTLLMTRGGENLFEIARDQLGSGADFVKILKANRSRLPDNCDAQTRLPKGLKLTLPASKSNR